MDFENFFLKYYVEPLGKYYTLPATITYACIFLIAIYLTYKLCEKLKIKFTENFITSLLPFVILGGVIRALRDAGIIYQGVLFVSPPIYLFMFLLTLFSIFLSRILATFGKGKWEDILLFLGTALLCTHAFFVRVLNPNAIFMIFFAWVLAAGFLKILALKFRHLFSPLNSLAIASQLLDAISATISIEFFGYGEQHVLTNFLMETLGVFSFIPVKFLVACLAVYFVDQSVKSGNLRNYLKFIIALLGLALGTRNMLRTAMLV